MNFQIEGWRAWAPGLESMDDWRAWCNAPKVVPDDQQQPDVSFLPAMQRRRLSRLARMMFHVAWPLADEQGALPLVFASRHGETPRTLAILGELAKDEPLSPTQFSLSVHNAIIGLWSILRNDTSEMTAMSAAGDGLEQALLEANGLLAEGAPAVLLVIAEELPPDLYTSHIDDIPFSYALALLLKPGRTWTLSLAPADSGIPAAWPHPLNLLRAFYGEQRTLIHYCKGRQWIWSRNED
ncbi:beta-ketoacyl synthase chain length factor [Pseudomonas sp. NCHU5208]|uniref:beta-ketoacyl synthase chain length factor n=1 Tax=unclassified Pseudomonas TaxID=196821 RepID=UPI003F956038